MAVVGQPFPLTSTPSWYTHITWPTRCGIFTSGATITCTLSQATATSYSVYNYWGTQVSTGSISGTSVTVSAPIGGWQTGWYRLYLTGPNTDTVFGPSYGASNFTVIRSNTNFPTNPAVGTSGGGGNENPDYVMKGVMGIGTTRLPINNVLSYGADLASAQLNANISNSYWTSPTYADSARPRYMWCNFASQAYDSLTIGNARFYCANGTLNGSQVFVQVSTGSFSGNKVQVYSPNSTTLVETFDNLGSISSAQTAINGHSAYVVIYGGSLTVGGPTAIGNSYATNIAAVVSSLYSYGVTRFEGPSNEPSLNAECATTMMLFQAAVHAGNASAKAIGPCPVNIDATVGGGWDSFLAAGGGSYCDEFSFHDYNSMTNGNLGMGRNDLAAFVALLAKYGQGSKPLWQTEAGQAFTAVYSVYHPRRARVGLLHTLLWEQYGIPRERNPVWYDTSHGYWSFPTWLENGDTSLEPHAAMYRVLAEETFGQAHSQKLSFGTIADNILLASVYQQTSGPGTCVLMLTSAMTAPSSPTVTLSLGGTVPSNLTVVDCFGNTSTVPVSGGQAVVTVSETPTYVRLPAGTTVSPYRFSDWITVSRDAQHDDSATRSSAMVGSTSTTWINDGVLPFTYGSSSAYATISTLAPPDSAVLAFANPTRVDRVVFFAGMAWQSWSTPYAFTVDTSVDGGTTWTTQVTVSKTTPSSFVWGTDSNGAGCHRETYWDEQWVFDLKLPAPVVCTNLRVHATGVSYGGEPDASCVSDGGQGSSTPNLCVQELFTLCDDNSNTHFLGIH